MFILSGWADNDLENCFFVRLRLCDFTLPLNPMDVNVIHDADFTDIILCKVNARLRSQNKLP